MGNISHFLISETKIVPEFLLIGQIYGCINFVFKLLLANQIALNNCMPVDLELLRIDFIVGYDIWTAD